MSRLTLRRPATSKNPAPKTREELMTQVATTANPNTLEGHKEYVFALRALARREPTHENWRSVFDAAHRWFRAADLALNHDMREQAISIREIAKGKLPSREGKPINGDGTYYPNWLGSGADATVGAA